MVISSILFGYSIPNLLYLHLTNYSYNFGLSPLVSPPSYEVTSSFHSCHPSWFKAQSTMYIRSCLYRNCVSSHRICLFSILLFKLPVSLSNHKHQRQGKTCSVLQSPTMKHMSANGMVSEFNKQSIRSVYHVFLKSKLLGNLQLCKT